MADSTILPGARAAIVVANGLPSPEIYRFFQAVAKAAGLTGDLQTQVTQITQVLEGMQGNQGRLVAGEGIEVDGVLASGIAVVSLATLEDEGGGGLIKISRDEFGRVAGSSPATTDDLIEGTTNFYATGARVYSYLAPGDGIGLAFVGGQTIISLEGLPIHLIDEAGNQLTDEAGNLLTDTATTGLPTPFANVTDTPTTLSGYGITDAQRVGDPVKMPAYTLLTLPSAATYIDCLVVCTNLTEGRRLVYSDGTNWLRLTNNTVAN